MSVFADKQLRITLLFLALSLIGGTGCVTLSVINKVHHKAAQKENEERTAKRIENLKIAAAQGDLSATTDLGLEYVSGLPNIDKDISKGIALLEQAAAKQYAPAEFALGGLLIDGRNYYRNTAISEEQLPRQVERGITLLKQAATHSCRPSSKHLYIYSAYEVSKLYREGNNIPQNKDEADLWLARSILHCQYPTPIIIKNLFLGSKAKEPEIQRINTMKWLLLLPSSDIASQFKIDMSPSDMVVAQQKMKQLQLRVSGSEKLYPPPPKSKP